MLWTCRFSRPHLIHYHKPNQGRRLVLPGSIADQRIERFSYIGHFSLLTGHVCVVHNDSSVNGIKSRSEHSAWLRSEEHKYWPYFQRGVTFAHGWWCGLFCTKSALNMWVTSGNKNRWWQLKRHLRNNSVRVHETQICCRLHLRMRVSESKIGVTVVYVLPYQGVKYLDDWLLKCIWNAWWHKMARWQPSLMYVLKILFWVWLFFFYSASAFH